MFYIFNSFICVLGIFNGVLLSWKSLEAHNTWLLEFLSFFFILWYLIVKWNALEEFKRNELQDQTPDQRAETNWQADDVLHDVQRPGFDSLSSYLDQEALNEDGKNKDNDEHFIVEEALEYIDLIFSNLSSVDQVENL